MQVNQFFNVTCNIDTKGNGDGKMKHAEHDPNVNHSNKNIDFNQRKNNVIWHSGKTVDDVLHETYDAYFDDYNKRLGPTHQDRKVTNINEYFRSKKGYTGNDFTMVLKFGTKEEWQQLKSMNSDLYDAALACCNKAMVKYAAKFNDTHKTLEMINCATNVDETSPHIHMQIVKKGFTKGGRPTPSLDTCLAEATGKKRGKKAMAAFNERESKVLQDLFQSNYDTLANSKYGKALSKIHEQHMQVQRPMGMSQEDYIATMQLADEARKQQAEIDKLKARKKKLQEDNKALEQEKLDNQSLIDDMQEQQQKLQESNRQLKQENDDLKKENQQLNQDHIQFYRDNQSLQYDNDRLSGQYDDLVSSYNDTRNAFQNYLDTTVPELQAKAKQDAMQANKQALDAIEDADTIAPILERNKRYNRKKRKKQRDYGPDL